LRDPNCDLSGLFQIGKYHLLLMLLLSTALADNIAIFTVFFFKYVVKIHLSSHAAFSGLQHDCAWCSLLHLFPYVELCGLLNSSLIVVP